MPLSNGVRARVARTPRQLLADPRSHALLIGGLLGNIAVPVLTVGRGWLLRTASNTVFAFGALVLGFAVLSWTAAVLLGPSAEYLQAHLNLSAGWTETGARRAFAVLTAFGAGTMLGSILGTLLIQALT